MKERQSDTEPTAASASASSSASLSSSSSSSRSSTTTRQRLSTPWVAAVLTVAVIAPHCCHGYSLSYRSPDVVLTSRTGAKALLFEKRRSVLPAGLLAPNNNNNNNHNHQFSSIVMSLQEFQRQQPPNMFLHSRRMTSVSSSLTTSSSASTGTRPPPTSSPQTMRIASSETHPHPQSRVLGFDISNTLTSTTTALQATRKKQSNVNVETWNGNDDLNNFFPSPTTGGLLWNSNQSPYQQQQPQAKSKSKQHYDETTSPANVLPLWFPWIPTKLQIQELKVTELRQACVQRGLKKSGNKPDLQSRLSDWTIQQQQQHQARLTGASSAPATTTSGIHNNNSATSTSPNSLAEWARTVDLEPLLHRRQEIHREKRQGRYPQQQQQQQQRDNNPNNNLPTPTKEYLTALTKAIQAPSAPNSNNVQVKELYLASKQADQMGERELAKELITQLLTLTPNDARLYRRLARMASEEGNVSGARSILQQGIRRLPHNGYLWQGLGQLELKQGDPAQARTHLRKAIEVDPSLPHAYHALGTLEHTQGRIANAMNILKQGIQYCPTNHRLHHALGDLYRGAKLMDDAERSYKRALEHSQPVSHCFAFSALAYVSYEKNKLEECRHWLRKSVALNNGRHAQGWVSLAQLEESETNIDTARSVCIAAITQYERGLIEMKQRHVKQFQKRNPNRQPPMLMIPDHDQVTASSNPLEIKNQLLSTVPRYRSGDRFLKLYRNWARLEERHGSFETVDEVYGRASHAFPYEYKLTLDWANYHASMKNSERARTLFMKACNKAANKHADPYRLYAEYEMYLGNHVQARSILYKGAQANSHSSDGGLGNRRGLAELFHTWAVCEWHLGNVVRAEALFDHSLRLTEAGEEGAVMRSFILHSIARMEYSRGELTLAQHCLGLCLKENVMPGGNAQVWELWAMVAADMGEDALEEECRVQMDKAQRQEHDNGPTGLLSKGPQMQQLMRRDPWHHKLFGNQLLSNNFYTAVQLPKLGDESPRRSFSDDYVRL